MGLSNVQSVAENSFLIPSSEADAPASSTWRAAKERQASGLQEALLLFASLTLLLFGRLQTPPTSADKVDHAEAH